MPAAEGLRGRVLIVDDAPEMRVLLTTALGLAGYEVVGEAGDGETAVTAVAEIQPDLVIVDARMPRLNGLEALARIKSQQPDVKVVVFSAAPPEQMEATARAAGADAYVDKIDGVFGVLSAFEALGS